MNSIKQKEMNRDLRRTLILGQYIRFWGIPEFRVISQNQDHIVEIYSFPQQNSKVHRIATVGVSEVRDNSSKLAEYEIMMTLPQDLGGATFDETASFLMDVVVYSYRDDVNFRSGTTIPETLLMPPCWKPRAALLDVPRGEPEELEIIMVGDQQVKLLWLVPIHKNEYDLIKSKGLDAFDQVEQLSDVSVVDVKRASLVK